MAGTAIATFINGSYPTGGYNHAAIYLGQDAEGIQVLDQWADKGKVTKRTIHWSPKAGEFAARIQNIATSYSVIN